MRGYLGRDLCHTMARCLLLLFLRKLVLAALSRLSLRLTMSPPSCRTLSPSCNTLSPCFKKPSPIISILFLLMRGRNRKREGQDKEKRGSRRGEMYEG